MFTTINLEIPPKVKPCIFSSDISEMQNYNKKLAELVEARKYEDAGIFKQKTREFP
jgi:hypothetical protein